jgi:hypothetical protein
LRNWAGAVGACITGGATVAAVDVGATNAVVGAATAAGTVVVGSFGVAVTVVGSVFCWFWASDDDSVNEDGEHDVDVDEDDDDKSVIATCGVDVAASVAVLDVEVDAVSVNSFALAAALALFLPSLGDSPLPLLAVNCVLVVLVVVVVVESTAGATVTADAASPPLLFSALEDFLCILSSDLDFDDAAWITAALSDLISCKLAIFLFFSFLFLYPFCMLECDVMMIMTLRCNTQIKTALFEWARVIKTKQQITNEKKQQQKHGRWHSSTGQANKKKN